MYLHLGSGTVVRGDEVVGVFDLDNTTVSKATRGFLRLAQEEGRVVDVAPGALPKTFVVCVGKVQGERVFVAGVSTGTIYGRAFKMEN